MTSKHKRLCCAKLATLALFTTGLMVIAGCTVGPDFAGVPAKGLPTNFLNSPSTQSWESPNLPARPHWHRFQDAKLNQLIDTALAESPNVKELHWRIMEATAVVAVVNGQRKPFAFFDSVYERRKRSEQAQPFVGPNGDPFDFFSKGINSQWEFDLVGRIRRETEAAQAEFEVTVAEMNDVRRLLVGEIARTYVRVRLFQELQHTSRANLKIQNAALETVRARIAAGKVGRLDLVQLESRLRLTESDIPRFNEQLKHALNQLAVLVGTSPNPQFLQYVGFGHQLTIPLIGRGVPADLVRYRPDIRRSEQDVATETARVGVATAELYPKLSLLGSISIDARNFSSLLSPESLAFTIGPSLTWNILSLGRIEKSIEAQRARVQQSIQRYQQTLLVAVREVEDSLASYHENTLRTQVLIQAVNKASESVELSEDQYTADRISLERVVSNQRRLLQASILLAETRAATAIASIDLVQATGVGWGGPGTVGHSTVGQTVVVSHGHHGIPLPVVQGHPVLPTQPYHGHPYLTQPVLQGNNAQSHVENHAPMPPGEVPDSDDLLEPGPLPVQISSSTSPEPTPPAPTETDKTKSDTPSSPLDQPVPGDSDGKTEILPPPKQTSNSTPAWPSSPLERAVEMWDDEDLIDSDHAATPWDVSRRSIDSLPAIDSIPDRMSSPAIEVAKTQQQGVHQSRLDATKSFHKWHNFRPDPKQDWYATPQPATETKF